MNPMSNSTQNEQLKKECYRPNRCDCEDCVLNREIWADDIVKRVTPKTTTRFCLICNQELEPRHVCKCPEHMKPSTQNDWAKEILFHLENLIVDIGTQVTDDYKEKNGLYEGMSIKNVRSRDKYKKIFTTLLADARKEALLKDRFEERDRLKKISNDEQYIRKQMYHGIDHENWDKYKSWAKLIANMVYGFNGSDKSNPPMKGLDQATQTLVDCLSDARKEVLANVAIMLWNLHKDEWSPGDRKWNEALDCAIEKSATLREEEKHG